MTQRSLWKCDLGFVASVIALYPEVVFGSARVIGRDALHYLIPIGASLRAGYLGEGSLLWDSDVNHGLPQIARWSPMVFYPGQWLNAVFAPETALSVGILLHLVLAASAMMRLALRYTDHLPAAWLAGFSYACGGYVVSVSVGGGYLYGAALLPLSLLALHWLVEAPSPRRVGGTAAVFGLQVLVADPQTLFYEALFVAPLVVFFHRRTPGTALRRAGWAAAAGAIALLIGACQWVPSAQFAAHSVRAEGLAEGASGTWAFHPLRLVQFLSPHVLGAVTPQATFWPRSLINSTEFTIPWAPLLYHGLFVWAGLAAIDWRRPPKAVVAIAASMVFFLLLSFGPRTPVFHAVTLALPGATAFRYPEKFLVFFAVGWCLLGAAGLGRLLSDQALRPRVAIGFAALAAIAFGLRLWLAPASAAQIAWFAEVIAGQGTDLVEADAALATVASSVVHTGVIAALIAALLAFGQRLRPRLLITIGGAVAIIDVLVGSLPQRYVGDATAYRGVPPACSALLAPGHGLKPLVWRYQPPEIYLPIPTDGMTRFELERLRGWQTLRPNTGAQHCIRQVDGYEAAQLASYGRLWRALRADDERRLRVFGVQQILSPRGSTNSARFPFVIGSDELETEVHRVKDPIPYALAVGRAEAAPNGEAAVRRVADPTFDFTTAVVLERASAPPMFPDVPRTATLRLHRPGDITIDVDFGAPGYLMLEETHYPGWRADSDGKPLEVERADGHFLAVQLGAGVQAVHFVFDPPLQRQADLASGVGLGLLGASLLLRIGRKPRRQ